MSVLSALTASVGDSEGAPRLLLTVHDELMVETPDEVAEQAL